MNYFKTQKKQLIQQDEDIKDFQYPSFVRTNETGDRVFFIQDGSYFWIENPETLEALGGGFDQVETIKYPYLKVLDQGESINIDNYEKYKG